MNHQKILNCLYLVLNDPEQAKLCQTETPAFFKQHAFTDEEIKMWSELVTPMQQLREQQAMALKQTMATMTLNNSFQTGIAETNHQTTQGFRATMIMYSVSFYLGVVLILAALAFAIFTRSHLFSILFGTLGTLDLLTFFIVKPPQSLQQSRSEQSRLNAAFYSWFLDLTNWNAFFFQYSSRGEAVGFEVVKEVSAMQIENTRKLMEIISNNIINTTGNKQ